MFNVTVIFTHHYEIGNCNSKELLSIVRAIQPELIFEELLPSVYDQIYNQRNRTTLESDVVKMFSMTNVVEHIPVDTFECPDDYYNRKNYLLDVIGKHLDNSGTLNNSIRRTMKDGFRFLNRDENDVMIDDITDLENSILAQIGDENLNEIAQQRKEVNSRREDVIIENIYKYCRQKDFQTAILFIGAGHRKSIKAKIVNQTNREEVQIKWHFLVN